MRSDVMMIVYPETAFEEVIEANRRGTWTINASILSEVVRQLRLDRSNGFNSGTLSIEPFGGSRCRGVLATTYAFSMVFLGRRKSEKHPLQRNEPPENSGVERRQVVKSK